MSLRDAPIGCVPIVWNNADDHDMAPADAGRAPCRTRSRGSASPAPSTGADSPRATSCVATWSSAASASRSCTPPCRPGPRASRDGAAEIARRDLERLTAAGGEVLVVALDGGGERDAWSGRVAAGAPQWSAAAYDGLADCSAELVEAAPRRRAVAFHPHTATWIEAPDEVEALASPAAGHRRRALPRRRPLPGRRRRCRRAPSAPSAPLVTHVHLKDVDGIGPRRGCASGELARLRRGGPGAHLHRARQRRARPGGGAEHARRVSTTRGWLMVEQDSSWLPPVGGRRRRQARARLRAARDGPMKVAVIGAGSMGGMHADLLGAMDEVDRLSSSSTPMPIRARGGRRGATAGARRPSTRRSPQPMRSSSPPRRSSTADGRRPRSMPASTCCARSR